MPRPSAFIKDKATSGLSDTPVGILALSMLCPQMFGGKEVCREEWGVGVPDGHARLAGSPHTRIVPSVLQEQACLLQPLLGHVRTAWPPGWKRHPPSIIIWRLNA